MRRWSVRTHLAGLVALAAATCARGERAPAAGPAVTDDAGRRVTLATPARRVVSLLPSFTEILFAIGAGDRLVGRTTWCDYPPAALAVPSVGDGMPPNVEAVAARHPDLVVLYRSGPNVTAAEQLERLGIKTVLLDLNLLEQLGPAARRLGVLAGRVARGARGAGQAVPVPSGPVVRAPRTARRGGGARAPPSPRATVKYVLLAIAAVVTLGAAVLLGPADVPLRDIVSSPIVWQLRLPRAVQAFLVGGALGVSGVALQALVRNPLADPFLLGLSGGAGLGAVAAIALDLPGPWALPLAAFVGALGAMALVYRLGLTGGAELDPRILLLGGVAVGAFAAAITTAIVSLAQATELRNAFLWLWGGFSGASWTTVLVILVYAPLPLGVLAAAARPLDLLALGEEPAQYLGADVRRLKRLVYLAASLLTAAAVAVAGVIGFVGLIVPHLCRLVWGRLHRALFPTAFLAGGILLAAADTLARTVVAPRELPVGIVTALLGVPVFAFLLRRWTVS